MPRLTFFLVSVLLAISFFSPADLVGQQKQQKKKDRLVPPQTARAQAATPPETLKVAKGFKVELLYTVPRETQGSWVNLCTDPKGRLITSDQGGPLYRITPPALGGKPEDTKVERIKADIGDAQGLLWAFDALYVMVNSGKRYKSGLYRVTDSDNDDMPDKVESLRELNGGGEHGPHAILPHPDGKRLTIVCGNQTKLTKYDTTKVPPVWGEDHLLPRLPDGNGFMRGVLGPGGAIYNITPDGKQWELYSVGYRNQYDAGYNQDGDLFTYDADMEWDMNTPWYRPTRVCLVQAGSEFGWRNGAGKYPPYYPDNLPGVVDIGPGSPTGVCFGTGAKFPVKFQKAFFICDWSYGKLFAVHLEVKGAGYTGTFEEFVSGSPLPLTDVVINPMDGAMYFTIGGRGTQSALYRVTYTGAEPAEVIVPRKPRDADLSPRAFRQAMETMWMGKEVDDLILQRMIEGLRGEIPDRFLRFTARAILEHQDPKRWADKALAETDPTASTHALLALARVSAPDPFHRKTNDLPSNPKLRQQIGEALNKIDFAKLTIDQQLDLLRVYHVLYNRFGLPTAPEREAVLAKFESVFPTANRLVNGELLQLLVFLEAPSAAAKGVKALADAPTQEEQMEYARSLRVLKTGWTPELRKEYLSWYIQAANFRGGNSLRGFLKLMREDAEKTLTPQERVQFQTLLATIAKAAPANPAANATTRPFVKKWALDELAPKLEAGLKGNRDFDRGRKVFAEARCFGCHRYGDDGSSFGPDLTGVAGRFNAKDLLESLIDPNKTISDQYAAVEIETDDGKKVVGRIVNLHGNTLHVNTDMLDPNKIANVRENTVVQITPSKVSMMPAGLIDVLNEEEALDLMAYLLSRGDRHSPMFKPAK